MPHPTPLPRLLALSVFLGLGLLSGLAEEKTVSDPNHVPESTLDCLFAEPAPALVAAAAKQGIPLQSESTPPAGPFTRLVILVSLHEGGVQKQWLATLQLAQAEDKEAKSKPEQGFKMYSSTGREFVFASHKVPIELRILGPWGKAAKTAPKDQGVRVFVNEGHLSLGLERNAEVFELFSQISKTEPTFRYSCGTSPAPKEQAEANARITGKFGLKEDAERSFAGSLPALLEFFEVLRQTPGTKEILFEVMETPSPWAILKALRGVNVGVEFGNAPIEHFPMQRWALPATAEVVSLPIGIKFQGKPMLNALLFVTKPAPLFGACAGIVGVAAMPPDKTDRLLTLRVLAVTKP